MPVAKHKVRIAASINKADAKALKEEAERQNRSFSNMLANVISEYVKNLKSTKSSANRLQK